jgi:hypothetical protein
VLQGRKGQDADFLGGVAALGALRTEASGAASTLSFAVGAGRLIASKAKKAFELRRVGAVGWGTQVVARACGLPKVRWSGPAARGHVIIRVLTISRLIAQEVRGKCGEVRIGSDVRTASRFG